MYAGSAPGEKLAGRGDRRFRDLRRDVDRRHGIRDLGLALRAGDRRYHGGERKRRLSQRDIGGGRRTRRDGHAEMLRLVADVRDSEIDRTGRNAADRVLAVGAALRTDLRAHDADRGRER